MKKTLFLLTLCALVFCAADLRGWSIRILQPIQIILEHPDENIRYGMRTQVPGIVISPYAPDAGLLDVRKFTTGDFVVCPWTKKVLLVP